MRCETRCDIRCDTPFDVTTHVTTLAAALAFTLIPNNLTDILLGRNYYGKGKYDCRSIMVIELVHKIIVDSWVQPFEYGC